MTIALLFRGPVRLNPSTHVDLIRHTYETVCRLSAQPVVPFLLTYTKPECQYCEDALDFCSVVKIKEPSEAEIVELAMTDDIIKPFPSGGSRINAFKQYFTMNLWVNSFRLNNFNCSSVFYIRTDVAFDASPSKPWIDSSCYTTAHARLINNAKWTCDYIGSGSTSVFCDAWDFMSLANLVQALLSATKAEDPLDHLLATKCIPLASAVMRFGGHLIRNDVDFETFFSRKPSVPSRK